MSERNDVERKAEHPPKIGLIGLTGAAGIAAISGVLTVSQLNVLALPVVITQALCGLLLIGGAAMAYLWWSHRKSQGVIDNIRESLRMIADDETAAGALTLHESFGPEAEAWNRLVLRKDNERERAKTEQAIMSLGAGRRSGSSDLDVACDMIPQGMLVIDHQSNVKYINGAAATFLSQQRDNLVGQPVNQIVTHENLQQAISDIVTGVSRRQVSMEMARDDDEAGGQTILRYSVRPVRRSDAAAAMMIIEDITQQRIAEESRHAFIAQAAHELRTPLTNIRLYVETAIDEGKQDEALLAKCLNVINEENRRLERIVSEMLSVAEIESGSISLQRNDVRLLELLTGLETDYAASALNKQITMHFDLPPKLPTIQADRDKLSLALHNLMGNAIKYTPEGGTVTVTVPDDVSQFVVHFADTGIGIAEEDQARIFDKFYRAGDQRVAQITGSGLGLALARQVIRLHGGDITLESELDKGSTFTLVVPLENQQQAAA